MAIRKKKSFGKTIGVADTMFARGDMGGLAVKTLQDAARKRGLPVKVVRYTVPGFKDLPVACVKLFKESKCDLVVALGMAGGAPIDEQCAFVADLGLQDVQLKFEKHVIGVMVYAKEAKNDSQLAQIMRDRTVKHCQNALDLLSDPFSLTARAGTGQRQGGPHAGGFKI